LNDRGVPVKESGIDAKIGGVHFEEAAFVFCKVNWKTPFQGLFFEMVEGFLHGIRSFNGSVEKYL